MIVEFNKNIKDFKIQIDENCFICISNERIEYFLNTLKEKVRIDQNTLKNAYVSVYFKNKINKDTHIQQDVINAINQNVKELINKIELELIKAKEIYTIDFPRHPLNKLQTNILVKQAQEKHKNLIKQDLINIVPIQIEFQNVSNICSNDRVNNLDKFKNVFNKKILPIIQENKERSNFFLITECEENGNTQKHTFMIIAVNNSIFIIDSAGHEKYNSNNIKEQVPSIAMAIDYFNKNHDLNIYYTHTRIQADHVNCYTMAYLTMDNLIERFFKNKFTKINSFENYLKSFFNNQVENRIFNECGNQKAESEQLLLPAELLVNTQMNSLFEKIIQPVKISCELSNHQNISNYYDIKSQEISRSFTKIPSYIRDNNGNETQKEQIKLVDNNREKMVKEINDIRQNQYYQNDKGKIILIKRSNSVSSSRSSSMCRE